MTCMHVYVYVGHTQNSIHASHSHRKLYRLPNKGFTGTGILDYGDLSSARSYLSFTNQSAARDIHRLDRWCAIQHFTQQVLYPPIKTT